MWQSILKFGKGLILSDKSHLSGLCWQPMFPARLPQTEFIWPRCSRTTIQLHNGLRSMHVVKHTPAAIPVF